MVVDLFVHVRSKDCVLVEVFVYLFGSDMLLKLFPASKNGIRLISEIDSRWLHSRFVFGGFDLYHSLSLFWLDNQGFILDIKHIRLILFWRFHRHFAISDGSSILVLVDVATEWFLIHRGCDLTAHKILSRGSRLYPCSRLWSFSRRGHNLSFLILLSCGLESPSKICGWSFGSSPGGLLLYDCMADRIVCLVVS